MKRLCFAAAYLQSDCECLHSLAIYNAGICVFVPQVNAMCKYKPKYFSYQRQFNHFTDDDKKEHLHFKSASSPNGLIDFAHQMTPFCHLYFI